MSGTVGMIGLGAMGSAMAANLHKAGFEVVGHDVAGDRLDAFAAAGGTPAGSSREVAQRADRIVMSLPSVAAVEAVTEGADGIGAGARDGTVVAETSTMPLATKERARQALAEHGVTLLDCPLSGTGAQAVHGDVVVYASGDAAAIDEFREVFAGFARGTHVLGEFGAGSKAKYIANLLVAVHNVAAAEALVLGQRAGLDPETLIRVIADGAGTSRMFEVRAPTMVSGDFSKGISQQVFTKDLRVIGDFATGLDCPVPLFDATLPVYAAARAQGLGDQDTASVHTVLARMAGLPAAEAG